MDLNKITYPYRIAYCIFHGWIAVHNELDGHSTVDDNFDVEFCNGLIVESEPPELEEDWQYNLQEPSPEELEQMDLSAKELMLSI